MRVIVHAVQVVLYILLLLAMGVLLIPLFIISAVGRAMDTICCDMMGDIVNWVVWIRERILPDCLCGEHLDDEEE